MRNNDLTLGAVDVPHFNVPAQRLKGEYGVEAIIEAVGMQTARWVQCNDEKELKRFKKKAFENLAEDGDGKRVYLVPTRDSLSLTIELWPDVRCLAT